MNECVIVDCSLLHFNMALVKPSISINVSLSPGVALIPRSNSLSSRTIPRQLNTKTFPSQKHTLPLSTSVRLFPQFNSTCIPKPKLLTRTVVSTSEIDTAVEEADFSPADNQISVTAKDAADISRESCTNSEVTSVKSRRTRPVRRSEMPPVKNEELIPGATFNGKIRSVQPFGAFVDFGAFTDGLVHVSRLSDSFVKDVGHIVTVGQDVTVRLIEANMETGRISLSMRESGDPDKAAQQQRDGPVSNGKSGPPRKYNQQRDDSKRNSKFVKGKDLDGTVKSLTRAGAFIALPEGGEGFLPSSEESVEGFGNVMGRSSLEVGQKVCVRVLRINRGQVTLTMKKEEDVSELDAKLSQGVIHVATNPFVLAFRSNPVISAFLDERKKENDTKDAVVSGIDDNTLLDALDKEENVENKEEAELYLKVPDLSSEIVEKAEENAVEDVILNDEEHTEERGNGVPSATQSASELFENPSLIDAIEDVEPLLSGGVTDQTSPDILEQVTALGKDDDQSEKPESRSLRSLQDEEVAALNTDASGSIDSLDSEAESTGL
ncbi:hypothetical protein OROGR_014956 [Orobanche gracilis]